MSNAKQLKSRARRWKSDPVAFAQDVLGVKPWPKQAEVMRAVAKHPRVALKSTHGVGKTFMCAQLVLWWLLTNRECVVLSTAATFLQVRDQLWREIHQAVARSRIRIPSEALTTTSLRLGSERIALGFSTDQPDRAQGFHAPSMLVVIDEASGVNASLFAALDSLSASGRVHTLMTGNPLVAHGHFHEAFTRQRQLWKTFTVGAQSSPNLEVIAKRHPDFAVAVASMTDEDLNAPEAAPGLTSRRWVYERLHAYGAESSEWQARVLGNFPQQSDDALIPLAWIEDAKDDEPIETLRNQKFIAGIDVAGPGEDETVACIRRGKQLVSLKAWNDADARGSVLAHLGAMGGPSAFQEVRVDHVGIGTYFSAAVRDAGYRVVPIVGGESARNPTRFLNRRAELHWGLREAFEQGDVAGLTDQLTIQQLSTLRYEHTPRGQIKMMDKSKMSDSPDRAEALVYSFGLAKQFIGIG